MEVFALFLFATMASCWKGTVACSHYHDSACIVADPLEGRHFLNQWIVNIEGGPRKARSIAEELGFEYLKKMRTHDDHYFFRHPTGVPHRHKMKHKDVLDKLRSHKEIISSDQQYVFELTLNELDEFEDMVGHSEPLRVRFTHFNPVDETEDENIELIYADGDRRRDNKEWKVNGSKSSSNQEDRIDFEAEYAKRKEELAKLDLQTEEILEKLERLT